MRIKIFENKDIKKLEEEINDFLYEHDDIVIEHYEQSSSNNFDSRTMEFINNIVVSIVYNETWGDNA